MSQLIVRPVFFIVPRMPLTAVRLLSDAIFYAIFPLFLILPGMKTQMFENINIAYGDSMTKKEKRRIVRLALRNTFRLPGECIYYGLNEDPTKLIRDVQIVGMEHFTQALEKGKGAVAIGSHTGNFVNMVTRMAREDVSYVILTKKIKNDAINDAYNEGKERCGVQYIDVKKRSDNMSAIRRALGENRIVHFIVDERKKRGEIMVPFFGKPAPTAAGPAILSLDTGAPLIPIFITHRNGFKQVIEILPPLDVELTGNRETDIYNLTAAGNRVIEDYIRTYPEQWSWVNPRWKT
ncbi:MAG: lysophospholipid acyltransferase family protein [Deltaproteobacteria bacterium]|nr:lysophospholipid acyltransferase family protein [Candidatus Zymogenaceae bacterium]